MDSNGYYGAYYNENQNQTSQSDQSHQYTNQAPSHALSQPAAHSRTPSGNTHQTQYTQSQSQQSQQHQSYNSQSWNSDSQGTGVLAGAAQSAAETLNALGAASLNTATRTPSREYPLYPSQTVQTPHSSSHLQGIPSTSGSTPQYPSSLSQAQNAYPTTQSYGVGQSEDNRVAQRPNGVNSVRSNRVQQNSHSSRLANTSQLTQQSHQFPQQVGQAVYNNNKSASPAQIRASQHLQSLQAASRPIAPPATSSNQRGSTQESQPLANQYQQPSTVDPSQVYDSWPEYRRKVKAAREAAEAASRADAEATVRLKMEAAQIAAEEARQAAEARKQELRDAEEAARKAHKAKWEAEREAMRKQCKKATGELKSKKRGKAQAATVQPPAAFSASKESQEEIKTVMLKLREINEQHPELLAQMWEQERQQYVEQSLAAVRASSPALVPVMVPASQQTPKVPEFHTIPRLKVGGPVQAPSVRTPKRQPVQSPEVPSQQARWPLEKKELIAKEATAWLNAILENKNHPIAVGKFLQILNRNPSYIELCEELESTGLLVERAVFARTLLGSVSHINQSSRPGSGNQTVQPLQPQRLQLNGEVQPNVGKRLVDYQTSPGIHRSSPTGETHRTPPGRQVQRFINGSWQAKPQPSPQYPPLPKSRSPRPYPAASTNKALHDVNDARVDYEVPFQQNDPPTILQLSTTPEPPTKDLRSETPASTGPVSKASAARKRDISDIIDLTVISDEDELPPQKKTAPGQPYMQNAAQHFQRFPVPQQPASKLPPIAMMQPRTSALEERLRHVKLVETIDKNKALRRSSYNPATIARDVLLATGKHPDVPGLNSHLDILRTTLAKLGQPGHRIDGYPSPDLSTIRWDIIDPGRPVSVTTVSEVDIRSEPDEAENADDESKPDVDVRQLARAMVNRPTIMADGHAGTIVNEEMRPSFTPLKGMQKKSKYRKSHSGIITRPEASTSTSTPTSRTAGQPTDPPSQTRSASGGDKRRHAPPAVGITASGYTAFRVAQTDTDGNTVKRRGRPVGWRKALHMKSPGPGAASKVRKVEPPPQPIKHAIFDCKWKDCFAKLHNLETLRKHVHRIHGMPQRNGLIECHWEGCGKSVRSLDKTKGAVVDKHQYFSFAEQGPWVNHVEQSHIGPVSWSLGDGPLGGFSDGQDSEVSEAYMSDSRGRQVTPRARVPQDLAGMTPDSARAIMKSAAKKSNKKAEEEAAARRELIRTRRRAEEDAMDMD